MALPEDVTTTTLTFGPYTDASGEPVFAGMTGTIRPEVNGKRTIVRHITDGSVIVDVAVPVTIDSTGTATVELAHTDLEVLDPVGFTYLVTWNAITRAPSPGNKRIALPASVGATADFDLMDPSPVVDGVQVPIGVGPQGEVGPQGPKGDTGDTIGPAGGALSGAYPNPGLNTEAVDALVGALIPDTGTDTGVALRAASVLAVLEEIEDEDSELRTLLESLFTGGGGPTARQFPGVALTTYGHSYTIEDGSYVSVGSEFFNLLDDRHGFATSPTWGRGGAFMIEAALTASTGYDRGAGAIWAPGTKGVVILDGLFNDITDMFTSASALQRLKNGIRYALTVFGAGSRTIANAGSGVTRSGTWTTVAAPTDKSHTGAAHTSTTGDYIEYTAASPEITVNLFSFDPGQAAKPTLSISVDGSVVQTLDMTTVAISTWTKHATGGGTVPYAQFPVRLTGLGTGAHTVRVTRTGGTGKMWVESFSTPAAVPPRVLVLLDPLPTSAFNRYATHVANRAAFHAAAQAIVDEYSFAQTVSLTALDSNATLLNADGVHPNDAGAAAIADIITPTLNTLDATLVELAA